MKNKLLLAGILILAMAVVFKTGLVLGEEDGRITEVCKLNGGILMARDNCPGGVESVPIGEIPIGTGGDVGTIGSGYIRFLTPAGFLLSSDGIFWQLDGVSWRKAATAEIPEDVLVDEIIYLTDNNFLTSGGIFYHYAQQEEPPYWEKIVSLPTPTSTLTE